MRRRAVARRRWLMAVGLAVVALSLLPAMVQRSRAAFTDSSTSTVSGSADNINRYLHIYSQSTDPDGSTGYFTRRGTTPAQPAATGVDATLACNLGGVGRPASFSANYLFSLKIAPAPLPRGLTQVTLTVTAGPDKATGMQPLVMTGVNTATGAAGTKYWFSVDVNVTNAFAANTLYTPHLYVTVTYTGFTTLAYYQYDIPVKVYTGTGPGPDSAQAVSLASARGLTRTGPSSAPSSSAKHRVTPKASHKSTRKPAHRLPHTAKPSPLPTAKPTPTATSSPVPTPAPSRTT